MGKLKDIYIFFVADFGKDISGSRQPVHVDAARFRPNLVISCSEPYVEDSWSSLQIGKAHFSVSSLNILLNLLF